MKRLTEFAKWFAHHFIGSSWPLLQQAFQTGLETFGLYDPQFGGDEEEVVNATKEKAAETARGWLFQTISELHSGRIRSRDREELLSLTAAAFGKRVPIEKAEEAARAAVAALDDTTVIDKLFREIPAIVSTWHPQLAHTLAPLSGTNRDWDWYREQIRASRTRGVKHPCIFLTAGGQIGVGSLPDDSPVPHIDDPDEEVLFVDNQTFAEITYCIKWVDLMAGAVPSVQKAPKKRT